MNVQYKNMRISYKKSHISPNTHTAWRNLTPWKVHAVLGCFYCTRQLPVHHLSRYQNWVAVVLCSYCPFLDGNLAILYSEHTRTHTHATWTESVNWLAVNINSCSEHFYASSLCETMKWNEWNKCYLKEIVINVGCRGVSPRWDESMEQDKTWQREPYDSCF